MAVNLSFIGGAGWQFFDNNGNLLVGGKIYTYAAGTTTPLTTYTSRNGNVANTNPIILDSAARTPEQIWSTEGLLYKYVVTYPNDVVLRTWDNIGGSVVASDLAQDLAAPSGSSLVGFLQSGTGAVARTVQSKLRDMVNVKDFGAVGDGVADDTAAIQAAIDAVNIGGTVYLFGGVFKTTQELLITKTISIVGEDCRLGNIVNPTLSKSCIYASSTTDGAAINVKGCVATLRNFNVYNNGGAVIVDGVRASLVNNSLKIYDMLIEGFHTAIRCTEGFYNIIQNTSTAFCDTGVRIDYCYNFYISALKVRANNTPVYDSGTYGIRLLNGSSVNMFGGAIENFANVAVDLASSNTSVNLFGVYFESNQTSPTSEIVVLGTNSSVSAIGCHAYLTFSERFITVDSGSSTGVRVFSRNNRLVYPTDSTVANVYVGLTGDATAYWDVAGDPWDGTVGPNVEYWTGAVFGGAGNYNVQYPINHPDFLLSKQTAGFHLTPAATTPTIPVSGAVTSGNEPTMFSFANSGFPGDDPMGIQPNYGYNAYLAVKQKNQWEKVGIRLPNQVDSTATTVAGIVADFNSLLTKLRNNGVMI